MGDSMSVFDYKPLAGEMGPAMSALSQPQRNFVMALLDNGGNQSQAYADAGYKVTNANCSKSGGWRLAHMPAVQDALLEVSKARIRSSGIKAVSFLIETLDTDSVSVRDRMKAAQMLMDRQGLHASSESVSTVVHKLDSAEMTAKIKLLAEGLGIDPSQLLGNKAPKALPILEAEVTEIDPELADFL